MASNNNESDLMLPFMRDESDIATMVTPTGCSSASEHPTPVRSLTVVGQKAIIDADADVDLWVAMDPKKDTDLIPDAVASSPSIGLCLSEDFPQFALQTEILGKEFIDGVFVVQVNPDANQLMALMIAKALASGCGYYEHFCDIFPEGRSEIRFLRRCRALRPPLVPASAKIPDDGTETAASLVALTPHIAAAFAAAVDAPSLPNLLLATKRLVDAAIFAGVVDLPLFALAMETQPLDYPARVGGPQGPIRNATIATVTQGWLPKSWLPVVIEALCAETYSRFADHNDAPPHVVAYVLSHSVRGTFWTEI